jgi:hypothetical protein
MHDPTAPPTSLIPPPGELRHRLAVALRDVDMLRRLIRVAEHAARQSPLPPPTPAGATRREVPGA